MRVLYVGQYSDGTTSKMRAEAIRRILSPETFTIINTHIPFYKTHKLFRSFGFRYKRGPLINNINSFIQKSIVEVSYDLVWVDKGVFINNSTINTLRKRSKKLVHFTPDPAFTFHQSHLFNKSISHYDYLITTKSFELELYYRIKSKANILYVTQGFDGDTHKKGSVVFKEKTGLVFIGHYEKEREGVIAKLLENNIQVTLAGIHWDNFAKQHRTNSNLNYLGKGVYGKDYVKTLQEAKIAWGAISKWIPELHTTRTFEIPACGTALLTEKNQETQSFFKTSEAIFYDNNEDLVAKVKYYLLEEEKLDQLTLNGYNKVHADGFDYLNIMNSILQKIGL